MEIQTAILVGAGAISASLVFPEVMHWFKMKKENEVKVNLDSNGYEEPTALEKVNEFLAMYTGHEHTNVRYRTRTRSTSDGMLKIDVSVIEPKTEIRLELLEDRAEIVDAITGDTLSTIYGTPDCSPIVVLDLAWKDQFGKRCVRIKFNDDGEPEIYEDTLTQVNDAMVFTVDSKYIKLRIMENPEGMIEVSFKDTFETTKIPCNGAWLNFITIVKNGERVPHLSFSDSIESPHKYELDLIDKIILPNGQIFKLSEGFVYGEFESTN